MIDAMLSGRGHIPTACLCIDGEGAPWCRMLECDQLAHRSKPIGRSGRWIFLVVITSRSYPLGILNRRRRSVPSHSAIT